MSLRIEQSLEQIVGSLLPAFPGEDPLDIDDRIEQGMHIAHDILELHLERIEIDADYVSELVKERVRQEIGPDAVLTYSNLYSRYVVQPVVSRKASVLLLLHQLAEPFPDGYHRPHPQSPARRQSPSKSQRGTGENEETLGQRHALEDSESIGNVAAGRRDIKSKNEVSLKLNRQNVAKMEEEGKQSSDPPKAAAVLSTADRQVDRTSEAALLRDLPYALQGLSSTTLPWTESGAISIPTTLPLPVVSLLHTLAEPSLLYKSLSAYIEEKADGLTAQSLRSAISNELRSYLGLIATLEGEVRRAAVAASEGKGALKATVTLKRCVVWTRDATLGLRLMSLIAEESKTRKGGQLITLIHSFSTSYGDPFVSAFAERLLAHLTRPFYDILRRWIYDGELSDPYHEFFVTETDPTVFSTTDPRNVPLFSIWENKHTLSPNLIPSIISSDLAQKAFLIGKSLNFIRHSCHDSAWVEAYSKSHSHPLTYADTATLESSIDTAYKATKAHLMHLMTSKFHVTAHLSALKRYLLLTQGDFVALLIESLAPNLDRPAGSQYRHTLISQLEHAVRGSNAQHEAHDVQRRLDARLTEGGTGETGWDVFTLEYKIEAPEDVVLTPWTARQYLKAFNFLWRLKRVEYSLNRIWRRCKTGARGVLGSVPVLKLLGKDWKAAQGCLAEMIHFISQLQDYILLEVLEASWDTMQAAITAPECSLDDFIKAHIKYISDITQKGILGKERSSITHQREDSFLEQLHQILKGMLVYRDVVEGLYGFSVAEFTRSQGEALRASSRLGPRDRHSPFPDDDDALSPSLPSIKSRAASRAGPADSPSPLPPPFLNSHEHAASDDAMLANLRKRLSEQSALFHAQLSAFLGDLAVEKDQELRYLGRMMNYNDVYKLQRRRVPTKKAKDEEIGKKKDGEPEKREGEKKEEEKKEGLEDQRKGRGERDIISKGKREVGGGGAAATRRGSFSSGSTVVAPKGSVGSVVSTGAETAVEGRERKSRRKD